MKHPLAALTMLALATILHHARAGDDKVHTVGKTGLTLQGKVAADLRRIWRLAAENADSPATAGGEFAQAIEIAIRQFGGFEPLDGVGGTASTRFDGCLRSCPGVRNSGSTRHRCNRQNGESAPEALRRARLAMLRAGMAPRYWASFIVIGG